MARRKTTNQTGIQRLEGIPYHDAWIFYACVKCRRGNWIQAGQNLSEFREGLDSARWVCEHCGFLHSSNSPLPFPNWPAAERRPRAQGTQRFWQAFFRNATEPAAYWKQCNTCGRVLPLEAFSRHHGWGPLERQMECRACKGAINAILNPQRTAEQLHEGSFRRRVGDMLLKGENQRISHAELFERFHARCFKTGQALDIHDRKGWAIDHILPSRYLYPLTVENAALLSREANDNKRDRWPSEYYTNSELIRLAGITGGDLSLFTSPTPHFNTSIDVNACVARTLKVRERSNLQKRIGNLKKFLQEMGLIDRLTLENRRLLGLD
jgi:hypothetical protein